MPIEYFIRFQGQCYDVGTRIKFKAGYWGPILEGTIEIISHHIFFVRLTDGYLHQLSKIKPLDNIILEILEPVYYVEPEVEYKRGFNGGVKPPEDDIFIGWIWYILIMVVGVIFRDRLTIWIFATVVFFLWKNGFFGGKK